MMMMMMTTTTTMMMMMMMMMTTTTMMMMMMTTTTMMMMMTTTTMMMMMMTTTTMMMMMTTTTMMMMMMTTTTMMMMINFSGQLLGKTAQCASLFPAVEITMYRNAVLTCSVHSHKLPRRRAIRLVQGAAHRRQRLCTRLSIYMLLTIEIAEACREHLIREATQCRVKHSTCRADMALILFSKHRQNCPILLYYVYTINNRPPLFSSDITIILAFNLSAAKKSYGVRTES